MENITHAENSIQNEIDELKTRFTNTQELYREVAALLFFRYGITPTANKLHQLVKKGSMSAPAEALNRFWTELREKSRVRIQAPDLPEGLAGQAGSLVAAIWDMAQSQARDSLAHLRSDIEEQLIALRMERDNAIAADAASRSSLEISSQQIIQLENKVAAEAAGKLAIETRLVASDEERKHLQQVVRETRESFSQELEKVRTSLTSIEARSEAEIKRYLLEIDRERILASKAGKELISAKTMLAKQQAADKAAVAKLQEQISRLREDAGRLKGQLAQQRTQLLETRKELASTNAKLTKAMPTVRPKATAKSKAQGKT